MEIKVQCSCGQRYAFEVEPVDGRMPVEILGPVCGVDGTELTTGQIREQLPTANAGINSEAPKLRISRTAPPGEHAAPPPPLMPPLRQSLSPASVEGAPTKKGFRVYAEPNMWKGMAGAAIGALIACAIWYGLWKGTEMKWGIMAIAVGWFAGFGARWMGRTGGQTMGLMTAGVALMFIIGFQAMRASSEMGHWRSTDTDREEVYQQELADAKKVVAAVPNGTDDEIRIYLAKEDADGATPNLDAISNQDVKDFRQTGLKEAGDMGEGGNS